MKLSHYTLLGITLCVLSLSVILCTTPQSTAPQNTVTFQLDLTDIQVEPDTIVGLRGSMSPLSWEESNLMTDEDNDGIYKVTIDFSDSLAGERLLYKYTIGNKWDLDRYGEFGNRVMTISDCPQVLPVDKWDIIDQFALESLLNSANNSEIYQWIYIVGAGKKKGLTIEEIATNYLAFWEDDYSSVTTPANIMTYAQFEQAKFHDGYFEEIENTPEKVVYKERKIWSNRIDSWSENGTIQGVSADDMDVLIKTFYATTIEKKGWQLEWVDEGDDVLITIQVK